MKFGKLIRRQAIQEDPFCNAYVDYKLLKNFIKRLLRLRAQQDPAAASEFCAAVTREADKVDNLYVSQIELAKKDLASITEAIKAKLATGEHVSSPLIKSLNSVCKRLDNTRAFVIVNYLAFMKILKKFDKKCSTSIQEACLEAIQHRPFYCSMGLAELLTQAELLMSTIAGKPSTEDFHCPVCLNVLANPVVLTCAHRFCWHCLARASVHSQSCPLCRKEQSLDPRHYQIDSNLQNFLAQHFPDAIASTDMQVEEAPSSPDSSQSMVEDDFSPKKAAPQFEEVVKPQVMEVDEDRSNVLVLNQFDTLLKHAHPGNIVIVDIDETLVMTPNTAAMFSAEGIKTFERMVYSLPVEYKIKVEHCQRLQKVLDHKVLVEHNTASVIQQLQKEGVWVMGCTARYANMAPRTHSTLSPLGIDLNVNAPIPGGRALQDPDTQALYTNGIIYTNAIDKGEVLNSFLENVLFRDANNPSSTLPAAISFVDDRYSNSESVLRGLHCAQKLNVPIYAYHYVAAKPSSLTLDPSKSPLLERVLQVQVSTFLKTQGNSVNR